MKTIKTRTRLLRASLVFGLIFMAAIGMAQPGCPININNNFPNCTVDLRVYIYENPSNCQQCPSSPQLYLSIPAASQITISCADFNTLFGCSATICDIRAEIIGPFPMVSTVASWGNTSVGISGGCASGSSNMDVSGFDININP